MTAPLKAAGLSVAAVLAERALIASGAPVRHAWIAAIVLAVAIPATFGYNILANRLNRLDNLLEGFGTTLIAMLGREGRL